MMTIFFFWVNNPFKATLTILIWCHFFAFNIKGDKEYIIKMELLYIY